MNPLVSVVIPTFNRKALLLQVLENVFAQTYRPIEVIVVDDGSTDGTPEAVLSSTFAGDIVYERLPLNGGPAAARNAGILRAQGRYIAFMESDDLWVRNKLETQVACMQALPHDGATVLYSQLWIQRPFEVLVRPVRGIRPGEPLADYLFADGGFIAQHTVLMPAALARSVLYDGALRLHEDWDFYIRLEREGARFAMVEQPLAVYFDDCDAGRASAARPLLSLAVLERWRGTISRRSYLALRAKIAPQLRSTMPLRALRHILEGFLGGGVSVACSLSLIGTLVHPNLRRLAYFVRGRMARSAAMQLPQELRRQEH